tara:strand:+ start:870 stop:1058 length:189 start_codon:yes stop_codon:yes gene_type:complete
MYIIKSPRIGVVGTEYVPKPGIQVAGLIWGGFIVEVADEATDEVSTPAPKKGAKNKKATKED